MSSPKVWFITGTSTGFGKQLTLTALARGDKVVATARNVDKLKELKDAGADTLSLDVTAPLDQIKQVAETAFKLYGRIDYLINNAGYVQSGGIEELTPEDIQAQFDTNVFGLLNVTRAIVPYMRAARSGAIANISSIGAWSGMGGGGAYCASKWAVSAFSESLTYELAEFGIKVVCIEPGYFRSNLLHTGNKGVKKNVIPDYDGDTAVRQGEALLESANNNQPGDVKKGSKVIIDVLTGATGKDIPIRLPLGPDSYDFIKGKCEGTVKLLDEWKDLTSSTNIDQ
ncbi:hypothetical protein PV10_02701 [Exophiala mesophila]|uniref:Ketoreductase domain-containing protein n=1 Tax=Exophiala mesophila TaxID=212818 RepID=A0A0D1ZK86_EXOME|nr:uncharacterized protein PV10_02701 [Exophiala mesophila]KIV94992.1 hypothetical protein PV10_02701 [Exophiala mesophila]